LAENSFTLSMAAKAAAAVTPVLSVLPVWRLPPRVMFDESLVLYERAAGRLLMSRGAEALDIWALTPKYPMQTHINPNINRFILSFFDISIYLTTQSADDNSHVRHCEVRSNPETRTAI
jgi:hypothetical protein